MEKNIELYIELAKICKATSTDINNHKTLTINNENITEQKIIHGSKRRRFCRIFWNKTSVIIAFRGSHYISDWTRSNLKIGTRPLRISDQIEIKVPVHIGFQNTLEYKDISTGLPAFDSIVQHLENENLLKDKDLYITGHSLGGALAKVFICRLYELKSKVIDRRKLLIVSFGAPAIGLSKFRVYFDNKFKRVVRVVNGSDGVSFTPPGVYNHVGKELWLGPEKRVINIGWKKRLLLGFKNQMPGFRRDHHLVNYIKKLEEQR